MDTKIMIALITSVTSMIVALISIIQSRINSKSNFESARKLEKLKLNIDNIRELKKFNYLNFEKKLVGLTR